MNRPEHVAVWDVDGVNPYSREVACILDDAAPVTFFAPVDVEWVPAQLAARMRRVLPAIDPRRSSAVKALRLLHGLATLAAVVVSQRLARRRVTVLVSWTVSAIDELVIRALGALPGVEVCRVVHNLARRTWDGDLHWRTRLAGIRAADRIVCHTDDIARGVETRGTKHVVDHPWFVQWVATYVADDRRGDDPAVLSFIGALRPDKGLAEFERIVVGLDLARRTQLQLLGRALGHDISGLASSEVELIGPSELALDDAQLGDALMRTDVVLAPYREVSQSGSVMLALSAGIDTVAFDVGGLKELDHPRLVLVPAGDLDAFDAAVTERLGRAREPRARVTQQPEWLSTAWQAAVLGR